MKLAKFTLAILAVSALTACQAHVPKGPDKGTDLGTDTKEPKPACCWNMG